MKTKSFLSGLTLLCLLTLVINTNTAVAQDSGPPTITEEGKPDQSDPADPGFKVEFDSEDTDNDRSLTPATDILIIDSDVDYEDAVPKVAHGYTEYGVAYEKNGHIYVTFVKYDGTIINTYPVTWGTAINGYPDIAFEGSSGLFVVAWEYYYSSTDTDVRCRAVNPYSGPVGDHVYAAGATSVSEYNPSLDCNQDDGSCLVAFTYFTDPNTYIYGRFMDIDSNGVHTPSHAPFPVTTTYGGTAIEYVSDPMVAWGWNAGAYIVVGTANMDKGDDFGFFSLVYETHQGIGEDQYMTSGTHYLVDPFISSEEFWEWLDYDIVPTGVTYDPCTQKFLVLFTHDWNGTSSDFDILLQMVDGATMNRVGYPIWIAWSEESETSGDISFLTNAFYASFYEIGPDRAAVTYQRGGSNEGIMTTVIEGNCSTSNPDYNVFDVDGHVLVKSPAAHVQFAGVDAPAVAGSDGEGKYLVVFKETIPALDPVEDIRGVIYHAQDEYTLSVDVNPGGKGSVSINPDQATYHKGDQVTLTANGISGWSFSNWNGDASGTDNPLIINIQEDTSITANFTQDAILIHNYLPVIWK